MAILDKTYCSLDIVAEAEKKLSVLEQKGDYKVFSDFITEFTHLCDRADIDDTRYSAWIRPSRWRRRRRGPSRLTSCDGCPRGWGARSGQRSFEPETGVDRSGRRPSPGLREAARSGRELCLLVVEVGLGDGEFGLEGFDLVLELGLGTVVLPVRGAEMIVGGGQATCELVDEAEERVRAVEVG